MTPLDYGRSLVIGNGPSNEVRFWVESRTRLCDDRAGTHEDYLQCGSCKSEDTFAAKDLFYEDNYDFLPVFGPRWGVMFRRKAYLNESYREVRPAEGWWNGQKHHLVEARRARELTSTAQVLEATYAWLPIVSQTEIEAADTGLRAVLECPVKTLNTNRERGIYQVDTGPVLLPDLQRHERSVDGLRLAFVAYNVPEFADFVVEVPTAIGHGPERTEVYHYSERVTLLAANRLFAIEG